MKRSIKDQLEPHLPLKTFRVTNPSENYKFLDDAVFKGVEFFYALIEHAKEHVLGPSVEGIKFRLVYDEEERFMGRTITNYRGTEVLLNFAKDELIKNKQNFCATFFHELAHAVLQINGIVDGHGDLWRKVSDDLEAAYDNYFGIMTTHHHSRALFRAMRSREQNLPKSKHLFYAFEDIE